MINATFIELKKLSNLIFSPIMATPIKGANKKCNFLAIWLISSENPALIIIDIRMTKK